jgi:hypothetical protein
VERSGSELPVVYESPWRALGRDLRAVAASCVLALRRLWRRQWQGDLPTPPFWPRRRATLFWPLVIVLGLGLLTTALLAFPGGRNSPAPLAGPPQTTTGPGNKQAPTSAQKEPSQASQEVATPAPGRTIPPASIPAPTEAASAEADREPSTVSAEPKPDLPVGFDDPSGLVVSARCVPASSLLEFSLSPQFQLLDGPERQQLAERWQEQARSLGYEHLRLGEANGAELGRSAVAGGGMILFDRSELG